MYALLTSTGVVAISEVSAHVGGKDLARHHLAN
jgi:hypothetical protein